MSKRKSRSRGRAKKPSRQEHSASDADGPAGAARKPTRNAAAIFAAVAVVCICVAAVHWPALGAKALQVDDNQYLKDNVLVKNPSWDSARRFLFEVTKPSTVKGYYQPLSMISLMLDYAMGGRESDPTVFHATSLALHVVNTGLLVVLMYLLFGNVPAAAMAGLLFGLHPMTVEPIPWVSERKTLLAALFSILCVVFYVRYATKGGWAFLGASLTALVLALMSKPTSTALPAGLILLDVWPLRRFSRKTLLEKIPFFLIAGLSAWITLVSQRATIGVRMPDKDPISRAVLVVCHNTVFYLRKIFWPADVTSHYPPPDPVSLGEPMVLAGVVGTVILIACLLVALKWTRGPLVGVAFFLVVIFPTMGVIGFTHSLTSDKFAYLPGMGLLMVCTALLAWLWNRWKGPARRRARVICCAVVLTAAAGEAVAVRRYIPAWKDTETLYRYMLARAPKSHWIRMDLAVELQRQGRKDEAIELLQQAMRIKPTAQIHQNLGIVLMEMGRLEEATHHYQQALQLDPKSSGAHHGLGRVYHERGMDLEAIRHYKEAIRLNPTGYHAYYSLATVYLGQGKLDEAIANYSKAVQLQPDYYQPRHALGVAYTRNEQPDKAIEQFRRAIQLSGDNVPSMNELARILIRYPHMDATGGAEPVRLAERCCELTGRRDARMLDSLAAAYAGVGQFDKAVRTARQAVDVARNARQEELARQIESRLALYSKGKTLAVPK